MSSGEIQFQRQKDRVRKRLLKYTRKAFRMLPPLNKPRILDIGCGSGVPTMELARLSDGEIIGMDTNIAVLNMLRGKVEEAGLSNRVKVMNRSLFDMDFPDGSFDVIWAEGSVSIIGFKRGLQEWKRLLKPDGFLVVHDEKGNVKEKLAQVRDCRYELVGYFELDKDKWQTEYFTPLGKLIVETRAKRFDSPAILEAIHNAQQEIDMFNDNPEGNSSIYFVMQSK